MEEKHKKIIQRNYSSLVNNVDLHKLLPKLFEKEVFTLPMLEPYKLGPELDQKRELFLHIQRRGPKAFQSLVNSLFEINDAEHISLACLLENKPFPVSHFKPVDKTNAKHEISYEINSVIPEENERDNVTNNMTGSYPFSLPPDQKPQHIRQLSLEAPSNIMINMTEEPIKVNVKPAEEFLDSKQSKVPTYRTRSKCRGVFLCINNVEFVNEIAAYRKGAEVDEENMKILFKEIGFYTNVYRNQTKFDMERRIKEFTDVSKNPYLKKADCLVVSIMSHGEEGHTKDSSLVLTTDGKHVPVAWIMEQFDNKNCPSFHGKPKILIFQICRGDNLHVGVRTYERIQSDGINYDRNNRIRNMTDILVAYSTLPGDKAYRDKFLGTWYIQAICKVFMDHAYDCDVESLLKIVDETLSKYRTEQGYMQTSCYENRGFKRCYFHPKKYDTNNSSSQ